MKDNRTYEQLLQDFRELQFRLEEANDTIDAIRMGNIDGLIVKNDVGHQLYTLESADHTYRVFIEEMNEGAVTLNQQGIIVYSNTKFATMLSLPLEKVVGQSFRNFVPADIDTAWDEVLFAAWRTDIKTELQLRGNNIPVDVLVSLKPLTLQDGNSMSVVITDLTEQKMSQQLLVKKNVELEKAHTIARHLSATLEQTVEERTKELRQRTDELEVNIRQKSVVEAMLRSNEQRLTRILETMAEGVVIYDEQAQISFANQMAQQILGLNRNE
ncbi:MAG: PAS domain S-box protein, partial [Sphingobacteriales bacterium]